MLNDAAAALIFGAQLPQAKRYAEMLVTTGIERGLLGPREADRVWDRHLLNCGVVHELVPAGATVVDVGSGAGLPGIPLALARPDLRVVLVEPLLRRVSFLREVVAELALDVTVHRGRAEDGATLAAVGAADVAISRAVAPLGKLMSWCLPLTRVGGRVLALKGQSASDELVRDHAAITRAGGVEVRLLECGLEILATATQVIEATRAERKRGRY